MRGTKEIDLMILLITWMHISLCRISDRGGGIPHDKMSKVMLYNFSTAEESINQAMQGDIFGGFMEEVNRSTSGPMHG